MTPCWTVATGTETPLLTMETVEACVTAPAARPFDRGLANVEEGVAPRVAVTACFEEGRAAVAPDIWYPLLTGGPRRIKSIRSALVCRSVASRAIRRVRDLAVSEDVKDPVRVGLETPLALREGRI